MDINQSSLSRYKTDKPGISRSVSDSKAASDSSRVKGSSEQSPLSLQQLNLKEGQLLKGQIIDHRYNEVTIRLEPGNQTITARLSGDISLSIGQQASFLITGSSSDSLVLKYLPGDNSAAADIMIQKALSASGFPMTEKNKAIVSELLSHNMPIDKQTLQTLIKSSYMNREASPLSLVLMYKNNIPMTPENIKQFEAYQNGTNQLLNNIRSISENITKLITQPAGNIVVSEQLIADNFQATSAEKQVIANQSAENINLTGAVLPESNPAAHTPIVADNSVPVQNELTNPTLLSNSKEEMSAPLNTMLQLNSKLVEILTQDSSAASSADQPLSNNNPAPLSNFLKPQECSALLKVIEEYIDTGDLKKQINDGSAPLQKVLQLIQQNLGRLGEDGAGKLLTSPEYTKLLESAFLQKWTITPEKLAKKTPIADLYQNLQKDMEEISRLVKESLSTTQAEQLEGPVKDTTQNIQFMKDLNEAFTYIQLPVQLKDKQLHSELYVLTRKKALRDKPDSLSVLLHLDMDNLGPLNVNITMNGNTIQARFHMSDAEAEQLVKTNLPLLSDALTKKGYTLHGEVVNDYQKPDFSRDFIEEGIGEGDIRSYTFDIRT